MAAEKVVAQKLLVRGVRASFALVSCTLASACGVFPRASQSRKLYRFGYLSVGPAPGAPTPSLDAFRAGLRDLGWVEGVALVLEIRLAEGSGETLSDLAAALV